MNKDPIKTLSSLCGDAEFLATTRDLLPADVQRAIAKAEADRDARLRAAHQRMLRAITPLPSVLEYLRQTGTRLLTKTHAAISDWVVAGVEGITELHRALRRTAQAQHLGTFGDDDIVRTVYHAGEHERDGSAKILDARAYDDRIRIEFSVREQMDCHQALVVLGTLQQRDFGQLGFLRHHPGDDGSVGTYELDIPTPRILAMTPTDGTPLPIELIRAIHLFPDPLATA